MSDMEDNDFDARTVNLNRDWEYIQRAQHELNKRINIEGSKSEIGQTPLDIQVGGTHYKSLRIQPLEFCVANRLGPCESAIIKYVSRWREKGGYEDLRKIKHYVDLLMEFDEKYPLKIGE